MRRTSIEELIVGAARGEPMDVEESRRVEAALRRSVHLRRLRSDQEALSADFAELRQTLSTAVAPGRSESRIQALLDAHRGRRPGRWGRTSTPHIAGIAGLVAAASIFGFVAAALVSRDGGGRTAPEPSRADAPAGPDVADGRVPGDGGPAEAVHRGEQATLPRDGAFRTAAYAPELSPAGYYSIVRVRIPVSSFPAADGAEVHGMVDAEVLLGEDGLAKAIRFDPASGDGRTFTRTSGR